MAEALRGYLKDPSLTLQKAEDKTGALEHYSLYCSNYLQELKDKLTMLKK